MASKDDDKRRYIIPAWISFFGTLVTAIVMLIIAFLELDSKNITTSPTPSSIPISTPAVQPVGSMNRNLFSENSLTIIFAIGVLSFSGVSGIIYYKNITNLQKKITEIEHQIVPHYVVQYLEKRSERWVTEGLIGGDLVDTGLINKDSSNLPFKNDTYDNDNLLLRAITPNLITLLGIDCARVFL